MTYQVVITREGDDWLADVPSVPGAHTFARSLTALVKAAGEVIVLMDDLDDDARPELELTFDVDDAAVTEAAKVSRNIQQAIYEDAQAFFAGIDKLASAKSINEAVQIQSDLARARGEVFVTRAKSTTEYFGKLIADGAKTAQENFSKVASYGKTA